MKRNLSGETVSVHSYLTLKSGSALVGRQGAVMRAIGKMLPHHLPRIYCVGKTWYLMETVKETLAPAGHPKFDWKWDVAAISMGTYWNLPEHWFFPDNPVFDVRKLYDYIEEQHWLTNSIPTMAFLANRYKDEPRLTHGDLTNENTIIQPSGYYKFIDWMGIRHPYISGHKDVDYGKLLQSLLGWGRNSARSLSIKEGREVKILLKTCPMAWFWCAIHFMRIKNRAREDWLRDICDLNIDYCFYLSEKVS
jgi:hypothetical protein